MKNNILHAHRALFYTDVLPPVIAIPLMVFIPPRCKPVSLRRLPSCECRDSTGVIEVPLLSNGAIAMVIPCEYVCALIKKNSKKSVVATDRADPPRKEEGVLILRR